MSAITDIIADMLTRIRNAVRTSKEKVVFPASKFKFNIANILKEEGYLEDVRLIPDDKQGMIEVKLRYSDKKESAIHEIKRVSKPGRRVYVDKENLPKVKNGYGIALISTSSGLLKDNDCRKLGVGGEYLFYIW